MESIRDLLIDEMRDLYDAEKQLVKALPKMVKAVSNEELSEAFENHLKQTQGHVERIERAFEMRGEKPKSKTCKAMQGLIEEAQETIDEIPEPLLDSAIICAAQKVEHYEIAGYGTLRAWANTLGLADVAGLLEETLEEEVEADEKLTDVAESVLSDAAQLGSSKDDAEEEHAETVGAHNPGKKITASKSKAQGGMRGRAGRA
jgi:ferritin-like metal-binding protein YciE